MKRTLYKLTMPPDLIQAVQEFAPLMPVLQDFLARRGIEENTTLEQALRLFVNDPTALATLMDEDEAVAKQMLTKAQEWGLLKQG
jgi:hypothetical protein